MDRIVNTCQPRGSPETVHEHSLDKELHANIEEENIVLSNILEEGEILDEEGLEAEGEKALDMDDEEAHDKENMMLLPQQANGQLPKDADLFLCPKCRATFSSRVHLAAHQEHCNPQDETQLFYRECGPCGATLLTKKAFSAHRCEQRKAATCDLCDKAFKSRISLSRHVTYVHESHGKPPLECDVCGKLFKMPCNLALHKKNHRAKEESEAPSKPEQAADPGFKCKICAKEFQSKLSLSSHAKRDHGSSKKKAMLCETCGQLFKMPTDLARHRKHCKTKLEAKKLGLSKNDFECTLCDKEFKTKFSLTSHVSYVHKPSEAEAKIGALPVKKASKPPYKCGTCSRRFEFRLLLTRHLKRRGHSMQESKKSRPTEAHRKEKPKTKGHSDEDLSKKTAFGNADLGKVDMDEVGQLVKSAFQCTECPKKFSDRGTLTKHRKLHDLGRPFECAKCLYRFQTEKKLDRHRCIKLGAPQAAKKEKPEAPSHDELYECEHCPKSYTCVSSFRNHKHVHDPARPFSCEHCKYRYSTQLNLAKHICPVIPKEKSFHCGQCEKSFTRNENLQLHMQKCHAGAAVIKTEATEEVTVKEEHEESPSCVPSAVAPPLPRLI